MEHLRRIIPRIDILHGLPGAISYSCITRLYTNYLAEVYPEKFREIATLCNEQFGDLNLEEAIKIGNCEIIARPLLPQKILQKISPYVMPMMYSCEEMCGFYTYTMRQYTHFPQIKHADVERQFQNEGLIISAKITERLPLDIELSKIKHLHYGVCADLLLAYKRYDLVENYLDFLGELQAGFYEFIPFDKLYSCVKKYCLRCPKHVMRVNFLIKLVAIVERTFKPVKELDYNLDILLFQEFSKISKIPDFTFNARTYNLDQRVYTCPNRSWRIDLTRELDQIPIFEEFCKSGEILRTGNFQAVLYGMSKYTELGRIGQILKLMGV